MHQIKRVADCYDVLAIQKKADLKNTVTTSY